MGLRPEVTPSLADDTDEFEALVGRIWGSPRVVETEDLHQALLDLHCAPARPLTGAKVRRVARIVDGRRLDFIANPSSAPLTVTLAEVPADLEIWDPVSSTRRPLPSSIGRVEVTLAPFGSVFVVEGDGARPPAEDRASVLTGEWGVELPGLAAVVHGDHPHPWTDDGEAARGYSGIGVYSALLSANDTGTPSALDLGTVHGVARVRVNGIDCGVAWTAPFRVDVSSAWHDGRNEVRIEVAVPWRNRLIAEAARPSGAIFAPMTQVFSPTASPRPAGLSGPVELIMNARSNGIS